MIQRDSVRNEWSVTSELLRWPGVKIRMSKSIAEKLEPCQSKMSHLGARGLPPLSGPGPGPAAGSGALGPGRWPVSASGAVTVNPRGPQCAARVKRTFVNQCFDGQLRDT